MLHARQDYMPIQDPRGLIGEDEPVFLLRAKDRCFVLMLQQYLFINSTNNPNPGNLVFCKMILEFIQKAEDWQRENWSKVRFADIPEQHTAEYGGVVAGEVATNDNTPLG